MLDRVTVVVVTHHSAHCLDRLDPLLRHCPHVIIVDNASEDGTVTSAQKRWPHASILALPRNVGFGAANNMALARCQTDFALLLNPDCEATPADLHTLVTAADTFVDAAVVAPQLCDADGHPEVNYRWPWLDWKSTGPAAEGPLCVGFVCGAAMLVRVAKLPQPAFDERFFLYYEDDDLCLRLLRSKQSMIIIPSCRIRHRSRGSVRSPRRLSAEYWRGYHHAQSKLTFIVKYIDTTPTHQQRLRLIALTIITLPLHIVFWSPKILARKIGRLVGAIKFKTIH